jgi:hypothetical protein
LLSWLMNRTAHRFAGIDFMELIPKSRVEYEIADDDAKVVLLLPRFTDPIFGRLVQPRLSQHKKFIRMALDQRGSWIWQNLGDNVRMGDLVAGFQEKFPNDQNDAPERLSGYLFNMWENKFVEFTNLPG